MTSREILKASLTDIIFENRNRQFGAYTLRKYYPQHLGIAVFITLAAAFAAGWLLGGSGKSGSTSDQKFLVREIIVEPITEKQEVLPPMKKNQAPPHTARASFSNLHMVKEPAPERQVPDIHDIRRLPISGINMEGPGISGLHTVNRMPVLPAGDTNMQSPDTVLIPDRQPEFPGGPEALKNFLRRHLKHPRDLEAGEVMTVVVHFRVEADGSTGGFEITRSAGRLFDREVLRVMEKMPRWQPAIRGGLPVTMHFFQAVTFTGDEF